MGFAVTPALYKRSALNRKRRKNMADDDFTPGIAMAIAYRSVTSITGSTRPIEPLTTLDKYNVHDEDLISIEDAVINNNEFGLVHFSHTMNPNALNNIGSDSTLQDLADVIFEESKPFGFAKAAAKGKKKGGTNKGSKKR
jgi:hypothetical protein